MQRYQERNDRAYSSSLAGNRTNAAQASCCFALLLKHHVEIFSLEFLPCYDHLDIPIFQMSF